MCLKMRQIGNWKKLTVPGRDSLNAFANYKLNAYKQCWVSVSMCSKDRCLWYAKKIMEVDKLYEWDILIHC